MILLVQFPLQFERKYALLGNRWNTAMMTGREVLFFLFFRFSTLIAFWTSVYLISYQLPVTRLEFYSLLGIMISLLPPAFVLFCFFYVSRWSDYLDHFQKLIFLVSVNTHLYSSKPISCWVKYDGKTVSCHDAAGSCRVKSTGFFRRAHSIDETNWMNEKEAVRMFFISFILD